MKRSAIRQLRACCTSLDSVPSASFVVNLSSLGAPISVNTDDIKSCIPHRDPFLWLDEVTEISETRIVAKKLLRSDLPVFQGHYPSFPVFPGVLQCEACFQAGAVLISKLVTTGSDEVPVVTRVNNVQFRRLIRPDETLTVEVELVERVSNAFYLKGKTSVDGKVAARLEFVCTATAVAS